MDVDFGQGGERLEVDLLARGRPGIGLARHPGGEIAQAVYRVSVGNEERRESHRVSSAWKSLHTPRVRSIEHVVHRLGHRGMARQPRAFGAQPNGAWRRQVDVRLRACDDARGDAQREPKR